MKVVRARELRCTRQGKLSLDCLGYWRAAFSPTRHPLTLPPPLLLKQQVNAELVESWITLRNRQQAVKGNQWSGAPASSGCSCVEATEARNERSSRYDALDDDSACIMTAANSIKESEDALHSAKLVVQVETQALKEKQSSMREREARMEANEEVLRDLEARTQELRLAPVRKMSLSGSLGSCSSASRAYTRLGAMLVHVFVLRACVLSSVCACASGRVMR